MFKVYVVWHDPDTGDVSTTPWFLGEFASKEEAERACAESDASDDNRETYIEE